MCGAAPFTHAAPGTTPGTAPGAGTPPLAVLDGGPQPDPGVRDLAQILSRAAETSRGRALGFIDGAGAETRRSYAQLHDDASRVLTGLRRAGTRPGDRVVLRVAVEADLLTAFWACVLGGLIAVPFSAAQPAAAAERTRQAVGAGRVVTEREVAEWRRLPAAPDPSPGSGQDTAALFLTAGSTGDPKAVRLSHANILGRSAATARAGGFDAGLTTVNWMPLDHVGGLVMFHLRDVFLGCEQIHAGRAWVMADPLRWLDTVHTCRANLSWGPNSFFDLVSDRLEALGGRQPGWDLSCLRHIMNGGQPIKARTLRRFATATAPFGLAAGAMRPGWGMSETASGVVEHLAADPARMTDEDRFVPVGTPNPGTRVRVVDEDGAVLPYGVIGRLQVAGPSVSAGYWGTAAAPGEGTDPGAGPGADPDPEPGGGPDTGADPHSDGSPAAGTNPAAGTAAGVTAAGVTAAAADDGWFTTGDMAFVEHGLLTVTGSADDFLLIGGRGCHGHEIEALVEALPFVVPDHTVACQVPNPVTGEEELAVICVLLEGCVPEADAVRAIGDAVAARFGAAPQHVVPAAREDIVKTSTGKPKRARMRAWFQSRR